MIRNQVRSACIRAIAIAIASSALLLAFWSGAEAGNFKVLHSFCAKSNCGDGKGPEGAPLVDAAGNLFGTTTSGGNQGGVVFELQRAASGKLKFIKLYTFCRHSSCLDGSAPTGRLVIDTRGNLYGTTSQGGGNDGVAFELSPSETGKWKETILHAFCSSFNCTDGAKSFDGLTYAGATGGAVYDGTSPLYGTTAAGGAHNQGTVFSLVPNGDQWTETVLYNFCSQGGSSCTDGKGPTHNVIVSRTGNLLGTTTLGGTNDEGFGGAGVAYELSPNGDGSWSYSILYQFCSVAPHCSDGEFPSGALFEDGAGNLLGTTGGGGSPCNSEPHGCGTVFKLAPNGEGFGETVLYAFCQKTDCKDGADPEGGVTLDPTGNLLGTTFAGGGNDIDESGIGGGVVFELSGTSYRVLHRFCSKDSCADGEYPETGVQLDQMGVAYGTSGIGGAFGGGTVFAVTP
jgi:uncharacterized repeat protein (TIGR03803 family)